MALDICHLEIKYYPSKRCYNTGWARPDEEKIETLFSILVNNIPSDCTNLPFASAAGFECCIFLCSKSCMSRPRELCDGCIYFLLVQVAWSLLALKAASASRSQKHPCLCSSQISMEISSVAGKLDSQGQTSGSDLR